MGDFESRQLRQAELTIQKCILDALQNLTVSSPPGTGLATEVTLQTVSATLSSLLAENKLDFELMTVKDAAGDIFKLRMLLDEETGLYTTDYIDATGNVATPGAGIVFLNPETLLNLIITELQTLNTTDFATAANQALALVELQSIVSQTSDVSTETTLAALLAAFSATDFATETTLTSLAGTDFATETTLSAIEAWQSSINTILSIIETETSNLDVALSTRATEATQLLIDAKLALLNTKLNTLGQKTSANSTPIVLSTEQEVILNAIKTAVENIDTDLGTGGISQEATQLLVKTVLDTIKLDTAGILTNTADIETLLTAIDVDTSNLDVALSTRATEATLLLVKGVLDNIKLDTAAIDANTDGLEALLTTIDAVLDTIKTDTALINSNVVLGNITLNAIDTVLDAIKLDTANLDVALSTRATEATLLTMAPTARALTSLSGTGSGTIAAGQRAVSFFLDGKGGSINGVVRPNGWSQTFEFDNDITPAIPYNGNGTCTIYIDYLT